MVAAKPGAQIAAKLRFAILLLIGVTFPLPVKAEGTPIQTTGDYQHLSGLVLPAALGPFQRTRVLAFDAAKSAIGADYRLQPGPIAVWGAVYISPAPPDQAAEDRLSACEAQMASREQAILRLNPDSKPITQANTVLPASTPHSPWLMKQFTADPAPKSEQAMETLVSLHCWVGEHWIVQYRVTYPTTPEGRLAASVLMERLPLLPDGGQR